MQWEHNDVTFWDGPANIDWQGFGSLATPRIFSPVVADTAGGFTCAAGAAATAGNYVTISGPIGGAGSIVGYTNLTQGTPYKVAAAPAPTTTSFTLLDVNGNPITTTVGNVTMFFAYESVTAPNRIQGGEIKISQNALRPKLVLSDYNLYGCLWVPATATTQGFLQPYLNGAPVGYAAGAPIARWNQYNSALLPPSVLGADAGSILDVSKMVFLFGTDVTCPMQIASFEVWQVSGANNIVQ